MGNDNEPWEIIYFSNSEYAGDLVRRRSISAFILLVLVVQVSWQSKFQKSASLLGSEAEYIALSDSVKKVMVMFVLQLLRSMKISFKLSIMIGVYGQLYH